MYMNTIVHILMYVQCMTYLTCIHIYIYICIIHVCVISVVIEYTICTIPSIPSRVNDIRIYVRIYTYM